MTCFSFPSRILQKISSHDLAESLLLLRTDEPERKKFIELFWDVQSKGNVGDQGIHGRIAGAHLILKMAQVPEVLREATTKRMWQAKIQTWTKEDARKLALCLLKGVSTLLKSTTHFVNLQSKVLDKGIHKAGGTRWWEMDFNAFQQEYRAKDKTLQKKDPAQRAILYVEPPTNEGAFIPEKGTAPTGEGKAMVLNGDNWEELPDDAAPCGRNKDGSPKAWAYGKMSGRATGVFKCRGEGRNAVFARYAKASVSAKRNRGDADAAENASFGEFSARAGTLQTD